jgi:hypothetical protein
MTVLTQPGPWWLVLAVVVAGAGLGRMAGQAARERRLPPGRRVGPPSADQDLGARRAPALGLGVDCVAGRRAWHAAGGPGLDPGAVGVAWPHRRGRPPAAPGPDPSHGDRSCRACCRLEWRLGDAWWRWAGRWSSARSSYVVLLLLGWCRGGSSGRRRAPGGDPRGGAGLHLHALAAGEACSWPVVTGGVVDAVSWCVDASPAQSHRVRALLLLGALLAADLECLLGGRLAIRCRGAGPVDRAWEDSGMLRWLTAGESHGPALVAIDRGPARRASRSPAPTCPGAGPPPPRLRPRGPDGLRA